MERDRFIKAAPYYYALGVAVHFKGAFAETYVARTTIQSHLRSQPDESVDEMYHYLENDVLLNRALQLLVDSNMLEVLPDDFGPPLYSKSSGFENGWERFSADKILPFYKYNFEGVKGTWLLAALTNVNAQYDILGITPDDFADLDIEWEPLPLDREEPKLQAVIETLDTAIEEIRSDNGYAASFPEERAYVLDSLSMASGRFKNGTTMSLGYLRKHALEPLKTLTVRFIGSAREIAITAAKAALIDWLKANGVKMIVELWKLLS